MQLRLQPVSACCYSLGHLRLQPATPAVTAWGTYGCSLRHLLLQPGAPTGHLRLQALDAELLWLRKELSLTKLELAQASGARDEAEHKLRTLVRETESETNEALGGF